jgi:hypothetical protein
MNTRNCDKCGGRSSPYIPRKRVGNEMWCAMCAQNQGKRVMAAAESHPDVLFALQHFGCAHTHGGRVLPGRHTAASHEQQESRLADPTGWAHNPRIHPVRFAIEGARSYNAAKGLSDPHDVDYQSIRQDPHTVRTVGRLYDALPEHDPKAVPHFHAMRDEVHHQFDHMTNKMGIKVNVVDHDPYKDVHELVHDVATNKRLNVLGTHVTGGHPLFSHEDNDKFRAVHDFFGHAATGMDFSRHGEQAAFTAHRKMFSEHAAPAMTSETKGQNTSLILNGEFGPQKIALLPKEHWGSRHARLQRLAFANDGRIIRVAHDSGDGETIFHCPFCGSGQVIARSDGTVECEFDGTAFTVQVQPQMPAFPQTVNGQPVDVPGMPNGGQDANVPPGAAGGAGAPLGPDGAPVDDPAAGGDVDAGDDSPADDDDDDKPAFLKGSSLLYRTASGRGLTEEQYMRHLAIVCRTDDAVLDQIRITNGAS